MTYIVSGGALNSTHSPNPMNCKGIQDTATERCKDISINPVVVRNQRHNFIAHILYHAQHFHNAVM